MLITHYYVGFQIFGVTVPFLSLARSFSQWITAASSVPQRSVLGPLLFLVYNNHSPQLTMSHLYGWPQDIAYCSVSSARLRLMRRLETWVIPINLAKCVYIYVGRPQHLDFDSAYMQGVQVWRPFVKRNWVSLFRQPRKPDRTLMVLVYPLGSIHRSYGRLLLEALKVLYASQVRPRLEYSIPASFPCTGGEMMKLERLQGAVIRMFVGLDPFMSVVFR